MLYASAANLKASSEALARDRVQFAFTPVWLGKSEGASAAAKLDAAKQNSNFRPVGCRSGLKSLWVAN
ncbi:hypothetical protein [Mesorhizobium sp.]|uniref:hypothetical protein n=1 Tax=Mesorhizobium sp. TaxID=1871066 RepID=UPI000FE8554E|nr:hypothetical protein [Mesorhizobium sp.]RWQ62021.1 MAG: hypothetical protein EOS86_32035 [Mesorhizobium sp.]